MRTSRPLNPIAASTIDDASQFTAPTHPVGRAGSVRITLPGCDNNALRLDGDQAAPLANVIIDLLDENHSINELELLSFTGPAQQEHVLTPLVSAEQPAVREAPIPTDVQPPHELAVDGRLGAAQTQLAGTLADHLPAEYGVETVAVSLADLGVSPVPACRLILQDRADVVERNIRTYNPLIRTVRELVRNEQPHLLQTLVRRNSGRGSDYLVTHRCAVFDPSQIATRNRDLADLIEAGRQYDLADIWSRLAMTSNFQLPVGDFTRRYSDRVLLDDAKYRTLSDARTVWQRYLGRQEYRELLGARSRPVEIYEDLLGYPRFPVTDTGLRPFLAVTPVYYDREPWARAPGRSAPSIYTDEVVSEAAGTEQPEGLAGYADDGTAHVANRGTDLHEGLLQFAAQVLREEGRSPVVFEQDATARPDGEALLDGEMANLEAEHGDLGKPGQLLNNKARAIHMDRPVIFLAAGRESAERIHEYLSAPYRNDTDDGVRLYHQARTVTLADGGTPLLPKDAEEAVWELTSTGTLRLYAGDDVIAAGDAETAVGTFDYHTPRYVNADGTHQIRNQNGHVIETDSSKDELLEGWTTVSVPHVPMALHYLRDTEIRYKRGDELLTYDPPPVWLRTAESQRDLYRGGVSEFMSTDVIEAAGAEIRYDTFRARFYDRFAARLGIPADPDADPGMEAESDRAVELKLPAKNQFGRVLPDHVERKEREVDGEATRFIRDHTMTYPPGMDSPDFPFFDNDAGEGDESAAQPASDRD